MADQPNILFIFCDQYRSDCLSHTGHPVVRTPNLDQVARQGVTFTNAYSSCPSCIAARASLMTGLHPTNTGRLGYQDRVPWTYDHMLPAVLRDAGYQTHCVGKTHFYPQRAHCGFEGLESYECAQNLDGDYVNDYWEWVREQGGGHRWEFDHGLPSNSWNARPSALPEELHNNTWVVTKGLEFLRRRDKTRPFFLNLSFHRPHPPIDPPQSFWDIYRDAELPPVPVGDWAAEHDTAITDLNAWHGHLQADLLAQARRAYYAQVAHIDCQIGRFLRALERSGLGNTIVVFSADHGEMLGDHHLFRKIYPYEGSAGVPFIIRAPGGRAGELDETPVVLEDLYPTILGLAGVPCPRAVDGLDLGPVLRGEEEAGRAFIHGEHSACYSPAMANQFLTDGAEKYIWFTTTGAEQLFDLREDPQETRNLAADPASEERLRLWRGRLVQRLAERPEDGLSDGERLIPGQLPAVRPELLAAARGEG